MRWTVIILLLLSGCTAAPADSAQESADVELDAEPPAETAPEPQVQEASISWIIPVTSHCAENPFPDPTDGITYGRIEVEAHTHLHRFTANFTSGEANVGFDVGFYDADNQHLESFVELAISGSDGTIEGVVPKESAYALFNTCGGGTSVEYRAGAVA